MRSTQRGVLKKNKDISKFEAKRRPGFKTITEESVSHQNHTELSTFSLALEDLTKELALQQRQNALKIRLSRVEEVKKKVDELKQKANTVNHHRAQSKLVLPPLKLPQINSSSSLPKFTKYGSHTTRERPAAQGGRLKLTIPEGEHIYIGNLPFPIQPFA